MPDGVEAAWWGTLSPDVQRLYEIGCAHGVDSAAYARAAAAVEAAHQTPCNAAHALADTLQELLRTLERRRPGGGGMRAGSPASARAPVRRSA